MSAVYSHSSSGVHKTVRGGREMGIQDGGAVLSKSKERAQQKSQKSLLLEIENLTKQRTELLVQSQNHSNLLLAERRRRQKAEERLGALKQRSAEAIEALLLRQDDMAKKLRIANERVRILTERQSSSGARLPVGASGAGTELVSWPQTADNDESRSNGHTNSSKQLSHSVSSFLVGDDDDDDVQNGRDDGTTDHEIPGHTVGGSNAEPGSPARGRTSPTDASASTPSASPSPSLAFTGHWVSREEALRSGTTRPEKAGRRPSSANCSIPRSNSASRGLLAREPQSRGGKVGEPGAGGSPYGYFDNFDWNPSTKARKSGTPSALERDRQRMRRKIEEARGWQLEHQRQRRRNRFHPSTTTGGRDVDVIENKPLVVTVTVAKPNIE